MRRRIVAAVIAGAAGVTLGVLPAANASASTTGGWRCDDGYRNSRWNDCCDRDWNNRARWCWDDDRDNWNGGWNSNWNSNWDDDGWRNSNRNDRWDNHSWRDGGWNNGNWNDGGWSHSGNGYWDRGR